MSLLLRELHMLNNSSYSHVYRDTFIADLYIAVLYYICPINNLELTFLTLIYQFYLNRKWH